MVKKALGTHTAHIGFPGFKLRFCFQFQIPVAAQTGRQKVIVQVVGSLIAMWETWINCPVLGFSLEQPRPTLAVVYI